MRRVDEADFALHLHLMRVLNAFVGADRQRRLVGAGLRILANGVLVHMNDRLQ